MGSRKALVSFVRDWCADDSHGYSQTDRWGPDCDCSSLMYMAAINAGYRVPESGTRYTGTMRKDFEKAGFAVQPFNGDLWSYPEGAIYLNECAHTEMDLGNYFGGAHVDENGNVSGGQTGDQSGNEVSLCEKYDYPWEWVLIPGDDAGAPENPKYRIMTKASGWLPWMKGLVSEDGSEDDYAGTRGQEAIGFDIKWSSGSGWFRLWTVNHPEGLAKNDSGDGSPITAVAIYFDTPSSEETGWYKAKYRVSPVNGDYYKWEYDDEDAYAGDGETPIDRLQLFLEREE